MIDRRRPTGLRALPVAAPMLLWLSLSALACTTRTRSDAANGASTGGSGGSAGLDASVNAGNAAAAGEPSGAGAAASDAGSPSVDSAVPSEPGDSAVRPADAASDAAPSGPIDAAQPSDAAAEAGQPPPGCPPVLPEFDAFCNREGLACQYGMECCPDWAYCEYGRWTLLTHHCDACP